MSQSVKIKMKKKAVSSSSWCPRHARRGCSPGCLRLWEEKKRTAAAAVWSTDAQKDAQTPLPSAARRTKQQRRGAAVRLCRPKPEPGAPGTMGSCLPQSQVAWVDRLPAESQSGRGGGRRSEGRTADGFILEVFSHRSLNFYVQSAPHCLMAFY